MILSIGHYQFSGRKGLLLFHQKCESAASKNLGHSIFDTFELAYADVLKDSESTRISSVNDMGEPEIQLLENAKLQALKSLPQSSLYWGSDLYHIHFNSDNVFIKLPSWFEVSRIRNGELELLELDSTWAKLLRNPLETYLIGPKVPHLCSKKILGPQDFSKHLSIRLANIFSTPLLNIAPTLCIDSRLDEAV